MKNKEKAALVVAIVFTMLYAVVLVAALSTHLAITQDTVAWLDRAQVASNPEDMHGYLVDCRNGIDEWGVTTGYAAIVWKTPQNYMPYVVEALDESIKRCEDMQQFDRTSVQYQVSLDDVRGQIRELDLCTPKSWWVQNLLFYLFTLTGWLLVIVFWCGYLKESDNLYI